MLQEVIMSKDGGNFTVERQGSETGESNSFRSKSPDFDIKGLLQEGAKQATENKGSDILKITTEDHLHFDMDIYKSGGEQKAKEQTGNIMDAKTLEKWIREPGRKIMEDYSRVKYANGQVIEREFGKPTKITNSKGLDVSTKHEYDPRDYRYVQ